MTRPVCLIVALAAMAATALVGRVRAVRARGAMQTAHVALAVEEARLQKQILVAQQGLARAQEEGAQLAAAAKSPPAAEPAAPKPAPKPPRSQKELLAEDPKLQAMWQRSERAAVARRHAEFFRELGLSAAQVERFVDLAMKQKEAGTDRMLRRKADEDFRVGVRELLGPAGFARWEEFERVAPVRTFVEKLAAEAALAGVPLNPHQASRLTATLAGAAPRRPAGTVNPDAINWALVAEQVPGILTDVQAGLFMGIASEAAAGARFHRAVTAATEAPRSAPR